jgi:hypothetical protein
MAVNPDKVFEVIIVKLVPIWGPFYALFYILRLIWKELFSGKED